MLVSFPVVADLVVLRFALAVVVALPGLGFRFDLGLVGDLLKVGAAVESSLRPVLS